MAILTITGVPIVDSGVVMSLASFDTSGETMTWVGVGDVNGVLMRANPATDRRREMLLLRSGVVGCQLPTSRPVVVSVVHGDTLVLAADGIRILFSGDLNPADSPQQIADQVTARHARGTDDALVLVARYVGPGGP